MKDNLNPRTYKIALLLIKTIPMLAAVCYGANSLLAYLGIDLEVIGYMVLALFIALLYILSYVFRFCAYHRMFIHYIFGVDIINIIDYYIGIPISDVHLFCLYLILTCIAMFITLYLYVKSKHYKETPK